VELDWDDANIDHIAQHHIEPWEAEEALVDPKRIKLKSYNVMNEKRQGFIGKTEDGRMLVLIVTHRNNKIRVVTARDASSNEKKLYRRQI
jgi:uncharacterized protein